MQEQDMLIADTLVLDARKFDRKEKQNALFLLRAKCFIRQESSVDQLSKFYLYPYLSKLWKIKKLKGDSINGRRITCEPLTGYFGYDAKGRGGHYTKAGKHGGQNLLKCDGTFLAIAYASDDKTFTIQKDYVLNEYEKKSFTQQ